MTLKHIKPAIESEDTVLGGLILDNEYFYDIKNKLSPDDFSSSRNKILFQAMCELYEKHYAFDVPMLIDHINFIDSFDFDWLYELLNNCWSTKNLNAHVDIIREKSVQRKLLKIAKEIELKELPLSNDDEMKEDFDRYTYVIQPSLIGDEIQLILVCTDTETNINANRLIEPVGLLNGSVGYLFGLMSQLTIVLKTRESDK